MRIVVAPDSYKGNLSAPLAALAIEEGILQADKKAVVYKLPLADGGEGTASVLTKAMGGDFFELMVKGPLGNKVKAGFGLVKSGKIAGGKIAVLDIAGASGLPLLKKNEFNPMKSSTYGSGELIKAALDKGATELIIGLGGSATNDGGIGIITALGFKVLDKNGKPVGQGGEALERIASVDFSNADKRLKDVTIRAACDVSNPMLGPKGASAVFGPQKGATPEMVKALDRGLEKLAKAWIKAGLASDVEQPGDGAAGGAGAALRICLGAKMESGAMLVMRYAGFFEMLKKAGLVITGEGRTDSQTAESKLCSVVARESRRAGVPVALLSGSIDLESSVIDSLFDYAVSISRGQTSLDAMLKDSRRDLSLAAGNLLRAILIGRKMK